jgi:hypothetical protein
LKNRVRERLKTGASDAAGSYHADEFGERGAAGPTEYWAEAKRAEAAVKVLELQ